MLQVQGLLMCRSRTRRVAWSLVLTSTMLSILKTSVLGGLTYPKGLGNTNKPVHVEEKGIGGMFGYMPPKLNSEQDRGVKLPRAMHCDGCRAVTHVMAQRLAAVNSTLENTYVNKKGIRRVKESAWLEVFEKICKGDKNNLKSGLALYGIKNVNGVNKLSGPGVPADSETGITQYFGSKWAIRLGNKCGEMIGEFSEEEIYHKHASGKNLFQELCKEDCSQAQLAIKVLYSGEKRKVQQPTGNIKSRSSQAHPEQLQKDLPNKAHEL